MLASSAHFNLWRIVALTATAMLIVAGACAPASRAASPKVLLTYEGEAVAKGETAEIFLEIIYNAKEESECEGFEREATVGSNPSTTVTIAGRDKELSGAQFCDWEGQLTHSSFAIKHISIAKTGKLTVSLKSTVETLAHCHYEVTKLNGTQTFGQAVNFHALTGTAHRQKGTANAKTCVTSMPVKAGGTLGPPFSGQYMVGLTG